MDVCEILPQHLSDPLAAGSATDVKLEREIFMAGNTRSMSARVAQGGVGEKNRGCRSFCRGGVFPLACRYRAKARPPVGLLEPSDPLGRRHVIRP